ncbi:MAG: enoyl-CoA hydratase/isomerase family protein [Myxococcota bacterium]|nr:enoyl-CoA hydratase/isomerase family protein [Myxococcota bacterium]
MGLDGIDGLRVERDGGIAFVELDFPPLNLMDGALFVAFDALTQEAAKDAALRVIVFRSADPDFFVAHGNLEAILGMSTSENSDENPEPDFIHAVLDRLRTLPQATIAQVEGYCRGGGSELALACDMRFAARGKAVFGQPEVGLGILPGAGGTVRLLKLVGRARAAEIVLGGDDFDADEAERYGWVNRALDPGEIGPFVEGLARRIASFPADAIAEIKAAFAAFESETAGQLVLEQNAFARLMAGPEARPRMEAALERGWQTREGEREIGARLPDIGS